MKQDTSNRQRFDFLLWFSGFNIDYTDHVDF